MKKIVYVILALALIAVMANTLTGCRWVSTYVENGLDYVDQKIDDRTNYKTRKEVEDTCRATIVSYESDKLTWEQYKDSESEEQRGWAESAKIRANKAALTYNEYFLKNYYVFDGNIPEDIRTELEILR